MPTRAVQGRGRYARTRRRSSIPTTSRPLPTFSGGGSWAEPLWQTAHRRIPTEAVRFRASPSGFRPPPLVPGLSWFRARVILLTDGPTRLTQRLPVRGMVPPFPHPEPPLLLVLLGESKALSRKELGLARGDLACGRRPHWGNRIFRGGMLIFMKHTSVAKRLSIEVRPPAVDAGRDEAARSGLPGWGDRSEIWKHEADWPPENHRRGYPTMPVFYHSTIPRQTDPISGRLEGRTSAVWIRSCGEWDTGEAVKKQSQFGSSR
jgi:hypothetical protein